VTWNIDVPERAHELQVAQRQLSRAVSVRGGRLTQASRARGAQRLLGLSGAQSQKLVGVSARFQRRAHELRLARRELYANLRPPLLEAAPRACSEEYVRDFLQARPRARRAPPAGISRL